MEWFLWPQSRLPWNHHLPCGLPCMLSFLHGFQARASCHNTLCQVDWLMLTPWFGTLLAYVVLSGLAKPKVPCALESLLWSHPRAESQLGRYGPLHSLFLLCILQVERFDMRVYLQICVCVLKKCFTPTCTQNDESVPSSCISSGACWSWSWCSAITQAWRRLQTAQPELEHSMCWSLIWNCLPMQLRYASIE